MVSSTQVRVQTHSKDTRHQPKRKGAAHDTRGEHGRRLPPWQLRQGERSQREKNGQRGSNREREKRESTSEETRY
eukprot:1831024-Pleurochrysis_carterae.AAC.2